MRNSLNTPDAGVADSLLVNALGGPGPKKRARFYRLKVSEMRALTENSLEVSFEVPPELDEEYSYLPGQYVALRTELDGREVRRSYSLCRPHTPGSLSVAIKKEEGGKFSTWAHTHLNVGDEISVMAPQGNFTSSLESLETKHIAAIAAGSGITPLMSLATTVLSRSATSRFTLIYSNRSTREIMFLEELADLKDRYPGRLALHHVLSREQRGSELFSGRINEEKLALLFEKIIHPQGIDEWFLCGPLELVTTSRHALQEAGVRPESIRHELFSSGKTPRSPNAASAEPPKSADGLAAQDQISIDFTLDGQSSQTRMLTSAGESILDAALRVRPDVPFACAGGVCGTCRAKVITGSVTMSENYALEKEEIDRGYVLTCQSHPTSENVRIDYDA